MKNILFFVAVILCMSSCSVQKPWLSKPLAAPHPFVQLRDGKSVTARKIEETKQEILSDDSHFSVKEVTFYSDGHHTYGRVRVDKQLAAAASDKVPSSTPPVGDSSKCEMKIRENFAVKIAGGDLSIFEKNDRFKTYNFDSGKFVYTRGSTRQRKYYFQKNGVNGLNKISYARVSKYVVPGTPGYPDLIRCQQIKRNRIIGTLASLSLLYFASEYDPSNKLSPQTIIGGTMTAAGICGYFYFSSYKKYEKAALYRAIEHHNAETNE